MATATKKSRPADRRQRCATARVPGSMELHVRDGAASALFARHATGALPVDLIARRDAKRDASDAERWLDEGGSFSSEAVAKWPAPG